LQIDWRASVSRSTQDQPDYRTLAAIYAPDGTFVNATGVQPNRFFRELEEEAVEAALDLTYPFSFGDREHRFKLGGLTSANERTYREQRFQYALNPRTRSEFETFPNPIGILGRTANTVTLGNTIQRLQEPNNYAGEQDLRAGYAMIDAQITPALRAIAGVRFEATEIRTQPKALVGTSPKLGAVDQTDALPALSLVFASSPKANWRFAYGRTLARPTYKELTDIRYEDVFTGDVYLGNPALQLTRIENFDARWEWFPRRGETLAVSIFHKRLKQPIEVLYEPAVGSIQPQNVERGTVSGVELEFRRGLRFVSERLNAFSVGANLTFIDAEVTIPAAELAILRAYDPHASDKRELLGQSPYVLNLDLSYDGRRSGAAATISYNITGERLDLVNFGPLPDVFEEPAPLLNLVVSQRLSERWRLRFSGKNLLDPERRKTIGLEQRDLVYASSTRGRSYALSLTYLFD
jgi:TonB-dependent receptor